MRAVAICLEEGPAFPAHARRREDPCQEIRRKLAARTRREQALAICQALANGPHEPLLVCNAGSSLASAAAGAGIPCLALLTGANPLDLLKLWEWQRREPGIIVLALGGAALRTALFLRSMRGKKATQINAALFVPPGRPDKRLLRRLASASHCLCGSSAIAACAQKAAESLGLAFPDAPVLPPGIDLALFAGCPAAPENGRFVFGMAESLLPHSGALLATRAMSGLWQKEGLPPWELRMFGEGPRFAEILGEAESLRVNSRLGILGSQPLPEMLPACDAWLALGESAGETPLAVCCGVAAGIPTIAIDTPENQERLGETGAALFVERANPQELARAMIRLMREPGLWQGLSQAALQFRPALGLERMGAQAAALLNEWACRKPDGQ